MINKLRTSVITFGVFALPFVALAQANDLPGFFVRLSTWITTALPIVVALALLYFLYGLIKFVVSGGNEEARKEAKGVMLWGIIALFVMVSVWGLVAFLGNTLGVGSGGTAGPGDIPGVEL